MKTRDISVIFLSSLFLICSCATYKQIGFPSELLGTWLHEFETSDGFYGEQAYTFNINGYGTVETRQYGHFNYMNEPFRFLRPKDISIIDLYPSSRKGKIKIGDLGYISYKIDGEYLIISGTTNNFFDQSIAKHRKLTETEVEKWLSEKENYLRIGKNLEQW
jgi:hypothetical protein